MSAKGSKILKSFAKDVADLMERLGYFEPGCSKNSLEDRELWRGIRKISRRKNARMWDEVILPALQPGS